jgi:putative membrane protein
MMSAMAIGMAVALATATAGAQGSRATLAKAPAPAAAHASAALDDPTIVAIFDAANTWDIQTGNLAAKKGHDKAVREFGQMIAHDHTVVRQQGRDLASKLHVTPTPPKDFALAAQHDSAMKKLNSLKGEAFDKAFLEHEVAFHKAVIDAVKTSLLPATQNTELKDLEVKVAPAFQAHMMRAQQLLDDEAKETH